MSKENENAFEGFNLLKENPMDIPASKKEEEKEEEKSAEDKAAELLEQAAKEAEEIANRKNAKKNDEESSKETEEESEEEQEQEEENEASLKPFISYMFEKGLLDVENIDEFDDTEEGLEKIVAQTVENKVNDWKTSYPEDAQKFLEFIENGGKPSDFHKYYYQETSFSDLDITDNEEIQKHVIREGLVAAGWEDTNEIEEEISLYEDAGKLESKAKAHLTRLQKLENENKKLLVEAQKKYATEQRAKEAEDLDNFKKGLFEKDEISGFKFSPKMKQEIWDYMMKPVDRKTGVTQYQVDSKAKGQDARYIFAYLMKNNWDASKLEKDLKNKVVSDVKKKLSGYSDSRKKITSGTSRQEKVEKEGENAFSAFKQHFK